LFNARLQAPTAVMSLVSATAPSANDVA